MHFLTHLGSLSDSTTVFGMSKSSASRYIWEVIPVVKLTFPVSLPTTNNEWEELHQGMEDRKGFPRGYLAVDGTLIAIECPHDYEGWYCRKGWPAFNIQIVMDHRFKICDFDIRPVSSSDKQIFNNLFFGQNIHRILPVNGIVLANADYTLMVHVLTPYTNDKNTTADERLYTFIHSSTRMVVEGGLGLLKNRFQIF